MPFLPLDRPNSFLATLGVMLYPGTDENDRVKARAFASQWVAEPFRFFHEAGHTLPYEALAKMMMEAGEPLDDLDERWWGGTATGDLLKALLALAQTKPALASWNNAIKIAELAAGRSKGSRTAFWEARSRFLSVAHLWGAWSIREWRFGEHPEVGLNGHAYFQSFLAEAENLRRWGQTWRGPRSNARPPLPRDVWQVPKDWTPPATRPERQGQIILPRLSLPEEILAKLKPAGRPSKAR
jgi:hypothetical protein